MMKLSFLALIMLLASCSSGSVRDCSKADWHLVGQIDQERSTHLEQKQKAHKSKCGDRFDVTAWTEGTVKGLAYHCSSDGAFWSTKMGKPISQMCDSTKIAKGIADGKTYLKLEEETKTLEDAISSTVKDEKKRAQDDSDLQAMGKMIFTSDSERLQEMQSSRRNQMNDLDKRYKAPAYSRYPEPAN